MFKRLKDKYFNRETITYLLFGIGTTAVNYAVYYAVRFFGIQYALANIIAWWAAVAFAFITNKLWVFQSKTFELKQLLKEIGLFVSARLVSFGLEEAFLIATVELLGANDKWMKLIAAVFVVIANYFFSKLFIFKKENDSNEQSKNQEV